LSGSLIALFNYEQFLRLQKKISLSLQLVGLRFDL